MKIGIIVAMSKELNLLLPLLSDKSELTVNDIVFHCGTLHDKEVGVLQCGIGKVNAAIGALTMIDNFGPDLIINSGVAGGTGSEAKILDVVVGERVAYHDVWCGPCAERGQIQGMPKFFTAPAEIIELPCLERDEHIKRGLIASGDMFVDNPEEVSRIKSLYPDVLAVDMESAAIAQVCHIKQVPFVSLRVISDTPGESDDNTAQYENFWETAPLHTFNILNTLLFNL